ncbi:MAG: DUF1223 domain-containing protein [Chitinophaga sp.]|uniref:DUF1223 domain-containing protein n=1 Tax=Chitinophaga sp. TaxID=1869181 RepID=UPI0025BC91A8|nr:DUF1223 domain-containing protein [Chitinophaga sp.]MBV8253401.1 DUF1223 domain-containing protein [Chitinophaga sp.]
MKLYKNITVLASVTLLSLSLITLKLNACTKQQKIQPDTVKGFAVLELFTSEGCSSCPPAEELLAQIHEETAGQPVFILAYHVDYWDRLGWKDHFSNAAFSKRQYDYSRHFNGRVYTPQVVVNGATEGVGADEAFVRSSIKNMLTQPSSASLSIKISQQAGKTNLNYETNSNSSNMRLVIAFVQKHAIVNVVRGENAGRTLSHAQIVRSLSSFQLGKSRAGTESIDLPKDFNPNDWEMIGLLQTGDAGEILAATQASIN